MQSLQPIIQKYEKYILPGNKSCFGEAPRLRGDMHRLVAKDGRIQFQEMWMVCTSGYLQLYENRIGHLVNAVENMVLSVPLVAIEAVVQDVDPVLGLEGSAANQKLEDLMFGLKLRKDFNKVFISDEYGPHGLKAFAPVYHERRGDRYSAFEGKAFKIKGSCLNQSPEG